MGEVGAAPAHALHCDVDDDRDAHVGVGLEAEAQDGHEDEEHRQHGDQLVALDEEEEGKEGGDKILVGGE